MTKRILLAGILGGVALFLWGGLSHMVLGLGERGVTNLPTQQPMMDTMRTSLPQSGFYFFPEVDASGKMRGDQVGGPWGVLIYHASGATSAMGRQLTIECLTNIVQALVAAFLLSLAVGLTSYTSRVGFVVLAGLMAGAAMTIEYWNWYGFPANYTGGMLADRFIGFLIVGLVVAAFIKPAAARMQTVPARAA